MLMLRVLYRCLNYFYIEFIRISNEIAVARSAYKITRLKNNEVSRSAYSYVARCLETATWDPHHLRRNFLVVSSILFVAVRKGWNAQGDELEG